MDNKSEINYTTKPLKEFEVGQRLYFKFYPQKGFQGFALAEFISVEPRGMVKLKVIKIVSPSWAEKHIKYYFPDFITSVRANRCLVWGISKRYPEYGRCCYWFKNVNDPIE